MMKSRIIYSLLVLALSLPIQLLPVFAASVKSSNATSSLSDSSSSDSSSSDSSSSDSSSSDSSSSIFSDTASALGILPSLNGAQTQTITAPRNTISPVPVATMPPPLLNTAIQSSNVFGVNLFTGSFARQRAIQFNGDYLLAIGDQLQVRMWGGFNFDTVLVVDPQGNVFIPNVGPVHMLGVANKDIQGVMESAVRRVYRANVYVYASLAAAQPVRIFVGGNVMRPGVYDGTSMDSLLHYLDLAGGIDPDRGSFLDIEVKRGGQLRTRINLYDFLLDGRMPLLQLADGDMIFVPSRQNTVLVGGLAQYAKRFEFSSARMPMFTLMKLAKPTAVVTHVRVIRSAGTESSVEYYPLNQVNQVTLLDGDEVDFTADKRAMNISVRVEGEHDSPQEYILPYGANLGSLLSKIKFNSRSERESIQLFRQSVKDRQKDLLTTSLHSLETAVLTARSGSSDEAVLRKNEADLALRWIDRAKQVEPLGQVVISDLSDPNGFLLENGDVIHIPTRDNLVLVSGEVLFPNSVAYNAKLNTQDYINESGGFTQNADDARIVLAHVSGKFEQVDPSAWRSASLKAGDQIMVLPKVDKKNRQFWKDMMQIIYQIAISAKVVLNL